MKAVSVLCAFWTGVSTMFTVGAGFANPESFAFALYSAGTVIGLLLFIASLGATERTPE